MSSSVKKIGFFEKYLTIWVLLCIGTGIAWGEYGNDSMKPVAQAEWHGVNIPVAILIWMMIYPMMVQVDFSSIARAAGNIRGLGLTIAVNWLIKPFSMAFFAWVFFDHLYNAWITEEEANQYIAGAILLGAAPCTAMVFVWSYLSDGDANYTLVQVSVNDLIILIAFVPIVQLLLGITGFSIPFDVLAASTVIFVVVPLILGFVSNRWLSKKMGEQKFKDNFLPKLKPISILALLSTLVLLFAFQGKSILSDPLLILLIAVPLTLQTYFIFFVTWFAGKYLKLPYQICAPASMIGASNFFELAVAIAIAIFGLNSGAALTTVVGVLIEVPIMLSLVALAKKWRF